MARFQRLLLGRGAHEVIVWAAPEVCRAVVRSAERIVRAAGFEFRESASPADYWLSQLLVRIAHPRIAAAVRSACDATNFIYYRDIPTALIDAVRRQLAELGIADDEPFRGYTPAARSEKPWSGIDIGVAEESLVAQWESVRRWGAGCCEEPDVACIIPMEEHAPGIRTERPLSIERFRELIAATRVRETSLSFRVRVGTPYAGVPAAMRGTALAMALLAADPALAPGYRGNRGSRVTAQPGWERVTGDDTISLGWLRPTDEAVLRNIDNPACFFEPGARCPLYKLRY